MKYCSEFRKFCDGECLECYDHIGKLNRKQYKFELKKRESDRIENWLKRKVNLENLLRMK